MYTPLGHSEGKGEGTATCISTHHPEKIHSDTQFLPTILLLHNEKYLIEIESENWICVMLNTPW